MNNPVIAVFGWICAMSAIGLVCSIPMLDTRMIAVSVLLLGSSVAWYLIELIVKLLQQQ